jgi:hypothetical protein
MIAEDIQRGDKVAIGEKIVKKEIELNNLADEIKEKQERYNKDYEELRATKTIFAKRIVDKGGIVLNEYIIYSDKPPCYEPVLRIMKRFL